ncbi:Cupredoxin, partial [Mycena capillaripes]
MRRSTSIHWHGIFKFARRPRTGNPSFVNQCPIAPNASCQYNCSLFNQTGTYWFHSHLSTQYIDGERGTLVIYPNDPQKSMWDVDDVSTIMTWADWYHTPAEVIMAQFKCDGHELLPDSGLINDVGVIPWAVINVIKRKKYRFRVITSHSPSTTTYSMSPRKVFYLLVANFMLISPFLIGGRNCDQTADSQ